MLGGLGAPEAHDLHPALARFPREETGTPCPMLPDVIMELRAATSNPHSRRR